jgi:urease accessory protein
MRHVEAKAQARFVSTNGQTVMSDRYACAPLKWSRTFADGNDGAIQVYLQDVSPGWMDGDRYRIALHLESGSRVSLRTVTYGKIHPSAPGGPGTCLEQIINLTDAQLSYCPEPVIPFRDADFTSRTTIKLFGASQLFWTECFSPGRMHKGERFAYRQLDTLTEIEWNNKLLVWDAFRATPATSSPTIHGAWEGYTHIGTIWLIDSQWPTSEWPNRIEWLQALAEQKKETLLMAASQLDGPGLIIRIAAHNAAVIQQLMIEIWQMVRRVMWNHEQAVWTAPGEMVEADSTQSTAGTRTAIAHYP